MTREAESRADSAASPRPARWSSSTARRSATRSRHGAADRGPAEAEGGRRQPTTQPTVAPIAARLPPAGRLDLLLVTNRHGRVLRASAERGGRSPAPAGIDEALAGREVLAFRAPEGRPAGGDGADLGRPGPRPSCSARSRSGCCWTTRLAEQFKRTTDSDIAFAADGPFVRHAASPSGPALGTLTGRGRPRASGSATPSTWARRSRSDLRWTRDRGAGAPGRRHRRPAVAHRAAAVPPTVHAALFVAAIAAVLLATVLSYAGGAHHHPPARRHHGRHARGGGDGRPDAQDRAAGPGRLGRRGRAAAGDDVQHPDRLGGAVPAGGRESASACSSLGRLSTVIAHEVRNPLDDHQGGAARARPEAPPADVREAVADIDGEMDRLNRIVNDVLDFARPPATPSRRSIWSACARTPRTPPGRGRGPAVVPD